MMHIEPTKYKCPKCEYKFLYSPTSTAYLFVTEKGVPLCPKCLWNFLLKNVPVMEQVEDEDNKNELETVEAPF